MHSYRNELSREAGPTEEETFLLLRYTLQRYRVPGTVFYRMVYTVTHRYMFHVFYAFTCFMFYVIYVLRYSKRPESIVR